MVYFHSFMYSEYFFLLHQTSNIYNAAFHYTIFLEYTATNMFIILTDT